MDERERERLIRRAVECLRRLDLGIRPGGYKTKGEKGRLLAEKAEIKARLGIKRLTEVCEIGNNVEVVRIF